MRQLSLSLIALLLLVGCANGPRALTIDNGVGKGWQLRTVKDSGGRERKYTVFIPLDYSDKKRYASIIFLHGIGERGSDGTKCTTVGLGPAIDSAPKQFQSIAIFPQTTGRWLRSDEVQLVINCLDDVSRVYRVDQKRVTLSGASVGGYGVWRVASTAPDRFDALVPICGFAMLKGVGALTTLPIWAFHNRFDPVVPSNDTTRMANAINAGGGNAKATIYNTAGHDAWTRAFGDPALWKWIAMQSRK